MSETKINYNEWDDLPPEPLTQFDKIIDLTDWPAGAEDDNRRYRVAWCQNMRATTDAPQRNGHEIENLLLDSEGEIQWIPVDSRFAEPSGTIIDALNGKAGTYFEMAKIANSLNKRQDDNFGARSFTFFPHPLEPLAA